MVKRQAGDQITNIIGEIGRWQLEKILIVFIAAAPGTKREDFFFLAKMVKMVSRPSTNQ